mgnify:CR=1 FL=1
MNDDPILRVCTKIIVGPIILFGLYVQFHGDYGPGGGFQAGVIVAAGTGIFFSNDGQTWLNIGRASVSGSGDNYTAFTGRSTLTRTSQGQCQFTLFDGATFDYGQVIIADGANKPYIFRMEGTGNLSTRTFFGEEITVTGTKGVKYVTTHDKHLIAAGVEDNLSTVFYSATLDPKSFSGTGSGSITLSDPVSYTHLTLPTKA